MLSSTCVAPSTSSPSSSSLRGGGGGGTDKPRSVLTGNYSSAAMFMDFAVFCMTIYCERLKQEQESARREKTREVMGLARFYAEKDPPDYSRAAEAYGQAAAMGDELARYNLAVLYLHGVGVDQDSQLAASLLAKAAEQNLPDASYLLGTMHVRGLGVERDAEKAVKLFEQAAAMGHEHAIEALADCHARGIGTRRSLLRAAQLFSEADQAKGRERQYDTVKFAEVQNEEEEEEAEGEENKGKKEGKEKKEEEQERKEKVEEASEVKVNQDMRRAGSTEEEASFDFSESLDPELKFSND